MVLAIAVTAGSVVSKQDWADYKSRVIAAAALRKFADVFVGLAKEKSQKGSPWVSALCPFHDESNASFAYNTTTGRWKCFAGCGDGGPFDYIAHDSGEPFIDTMCRLGDTLGVERPVSAKTKTKDGRRAVSREENITASTTPTATTGTQTGMEPRPVKTKPDNPPIPETLVRQWQIKLFADSDRLAYLHDKRGLTDATISEFEIGFSPERKRYTIPVRDDHGKLVNVRLYSSDPASTAKMINFKMGHGGKYGYGTPARLFSLHRITPMGKVDDDGSPVVPPVICIAEGEFDAMALWQHGFDAVTSTHGADSFDESWVPIFKDRHVAILFDLDEAGKRGAGKVVEKLRTAGTKSVHNVLLPLKGTPDDKDVSDFFLGSGGIDDQPDASKMIELREIIQKTPAYSYKGNPAATAATVTKKSPDNRPAIEYVTGHGYVSVLSAIKFGVARDPMIFVRGRRLVTIAETEITAPTAIAAVDAEPSSYEESKQSDKKIHREAGTPVIVSISRASVWSLLSRTVSWRKWIEYKGDHRPIDPPQDVVSAVFGADSWPGVRSLNAITTVPILRPDGTIHQDHGYDTATKSFYFSNSTSKLASLKIPEAPTRDDAMAALSQLLEVVCDFPFEGDAHQSAWLAGLLSVVAWPAYDGCAPLFMFDANTRGAGKTILCDAISIISTGQMMPRSPYVSHDDELRKRITSHVLAGDTQVLIDNIPGGTTIGWPSLDAILTGQVWSDRILGATEIVKLTQSIVWFVTGNNLGVKEDTARRTLSIRLESQEEFPELRQGFKHPNLMAWTRDNRPRLVVAALTMLRAYILHAASKGADPAVTPLGSFEGWSGLVRNSILWLGQADPLLTLASRNPDADPERSAHIALMVAWMSLDPKRQGIESGALLRWLASDSNADPARVLDIAPAWNVDLPNAVDMETVKTDIKDAILELLPPRGAAPLPTAKSLGKTLRRLCNRRRGIGDATDGTDSTALTNPNELAPRKGINSLAFGRTLSAGKSSSTRWIVSES